ncbi:MAG: hypothetical protein HFACDABA_00580 [Anaerolineales bacterium]|nr:hypothetical protein [Anaerolineales bacterium]
MKLFLAALICVGVVGVGYYWVRGFVSSGKWQYSELPLVKWDSWLGQLVVDTLVWNEKLLKTGDKYKELGLTRVSMNVENYKRHGYVGLTIEPKPVGEDYIFSKPYRLLGYSATIKEGMEMVLIYVGWKSADGKLGIITYVVPREIYEWSDFEMRIQEMLTDETKRPLMPVVMIENIEKCIELTGVERGYCTWFENNRERIFDLAMEWVSTRKLPDKLSNYPLLINW